MAFSFHLERELLDLCTDLKNGTWQPSPFRFFEIHDPKHRTVAVAPFKDRVVHHALVNILEPIWERRFIHQSYATRKNKGVHAAVGQAQHYLKHSQWFLKTDVEHFFDSINHDILLKIVSRTIKDKSMLSICERIVRHGGHNGIGLPIGNRTSQFFANVYLHPLDMFIKQELRTKAYVRYMDDFVLFHNNKDLLKEHKRAVEDFLKNELHLTLKPSATFLNSRQNGLSFLGTRIFPNLIRLRNENLRRITRRIKVIERWFEEGRLTETHFLQSMNSYWAMLQYYDFYGLRRSMLDLT